MADRTDGARSVTPLTGPYQTPYNVTVQYGTGRRQAGITLGSGADWFGPLNPPFPVAPEEVRGRTWDFPAGYNVDIRPRAYEPITFGDLRGLAESYDLLRCVIETRKDQMGRLDWIIAPRDEAIANGKKEAPAALTAQAAAAEKFFRRPNGIHRWADWLRFLLEDLFVIDAPALFVYRNRGGKLLTAPGRPGEVCGLNPVDGARIKRVIDDWGNTPAYPAPAYQHILHGVQATEYTTRDILYRPRNARVHRAYGMSPVEQILMTVNIALRRQLFTLQYFTEGNIPESLIGVPETWTPDQILTFQANWDAMLEGNLAARRHAKFVPGGVGKTFVTTKDPELKGIFDEWLARITCYAFSVSPEPFVTKVNRATAETAHDAALEEGLAPLQDFIKGWIDDILESPDLLASPDLEFKWKDDREVDPEKQEKIVTGYVKAAIYTINEGRDILGMDPLDDPAAEIPMVQTATGFVPINANTIAGKQENLDAFGPPPQGPGGDGGNSGAAAPGRDGAGSAPADGGGGGNRDGAGRAVADGRGARDAGAGGDAKGKEAGKVAKGADDQQRDDHGRFSSGGSKEERLKVAREARQQRQAQLRQHEDSETARIVEMSDEEFEQSLRQMGDALRESRRKAKEAGKAATVPFGLGKARTRRVASMRYERPSVRKAQARMAAGIAKALRATAKSVAGQLSTSLRKDAASDKKAKQIADELDLSDLIDVVALSSDELTGIAQESAVNILAQLGADDDSELVNQVNEAAAEWASDRAAEMVGMRYDEDGNLVEAARAEYRIDETTRDAVRDVIGDGLADNLPIDDIIANVQDAGAFSEDRAELIARTEITRANNQGSLVGARGARDDLGLSMTKSWLTAGDDLVDEDTCQPNEDQGAIGLDEDFESGDDAPPGHPRCRCTMVYDATEPDASEEDVAEKLRKARVPDDERYTPEDELPEGFYDQVKALVDAAEVVEGYNVPWAAGRSIDGKEFYPDQDLPKVIAKVKTRRSVAFHESGEWLRMNAGETYDKDSEPPGAAHYDANGVEKLEVERQGGNWREYCKAFRPLIKQIDDDALTNLPPADKWDKRPYSEDDRKLLDEIDAADK